MTLYLRPIDGVAAGKTFNQLLLARRWS